MDIDGSGAGADDFLGGCPDQVGALGPAFFCEVEPGRGFVQPSADGFGFPLVQDMVQENFRFFGHEAEGITVQVDGIGGKKKPFPEFFQGVLGVQFQGERFMGLKIGNCVCHLKE